MSTNEYFDNADLDALPKGSTARAEAVDAKFNAITTGLDKLPGEAYLKRGTINYAVSTGSNNAYLVTLPSAPTSYADGQELVFKANHANDDAATVNVNSLGVKALRRRAGGVMVAGDIPEGGIVLFRYNSTTGYFELQQISAGDQDAINTCADNISTIQTAADTVTSAGIAADIAAVADIDTDVTTCASNIAAIVAAPAEAAAAASSATDAESAAQSMAIRWTFDSGTSMADPGTGKFRLNNASAASATAVAVSAASIVSGNPDYSDYIASWGIGVIVLKQTANIFAIYNVSGVTDNGDWLQLSVTHIDSGGTFTGDAFATFFAGVQDIPQNSQSAAYELVLADRGRHILHPAADTTARIWTIPANASVAFPIGTTITFVNQHGAGVITIAITSDTMRLAGSGLTGSRTLAADGIATALKITGTEWIISGVGVA